jgi:NDP-sugar pyrophosphorylase family protein
MNTQVAILAGGMATRLGLLTRSRPKSLVMIDTKPFLEHQIMMLKKSEVKEIVLCVGHFAQQIVNYFRDGTSYGVHITYSIEEKPLGTAGALKNAERLLNEVFLTLYGDSFLSLNFEEILSFFMRSQKIGLMTVFKNDGLYDRSNTCVDDVGMVVKYSKQSETGLEYIDYGLNVFQKKVLEMIPPDEYYTLEQVFNRLIGMRQLISFETKERFYEIGSITGLAEFQKYVRSVRQ